MQRGSGEGLEIKEGLQGYQLKVHKKTHEFTK
jgi:hypothetical protein